MKHNIKQTTMRHILFFILIIGFIFVGCNQNRQNVAIEEEQNNITTSKESEEIKIDEEEIRDLIRNALKWFDLYLIDYTPAITDEKDSIVIGFDMKKINKNISELKKTGFFATEFIENYNLIILTLDKKIKNKEIEWLFGDFPPFNFDCNLSPWLEGQDTYDEVINFWDNIEIQIIRLNNKNGELEYHYNWRKLESSAWKGDGYKIRVTKENNKWKISYMEGFDFEYGTKIWK